MLMTAPARTNTTSQAALVEKANPRLGGMPLGFEAGDSNLYRYVNNKLTNERDPSGLVGGVRHHAYPLFVGGSNSQPAFVLESVQAHNAAHNYLAQHGVAVQNPKRAREVWRTLSQARRRELIVGSLRAAGVPESLIARHIGAVMEGATPGTAVKRIAGYPGGLISVAAERAAERVAGTAGRTVLRFAGRGLRSGFGIVSNPYVMAITEILVDPTPFAGSARLPAEQLLFPSGSPETSRLPRGTYITPIGQIYIPLPEAEFGRSDFQPPPGSVVVIRGGVVVGQSVRPGATYPPDAVRPVSPWALLIPVGMSEEQARIEYARHLDLATGNSAGQTPSFVEWLRRTYPNPERPINR